MQTQTMYKKQKHQFGIDRKTKEYCDVPAKYWEDRSALPTAQEQKFQQEVCANQR